MKNKQIISLIIIVLLILVGFIFFSNSTEQNSEEVIKVGGLFNLTGLGASWGEVEQNGVTLAIEKINAKGGIDGKLLELISEDTATNNTKSVTAVRKLIDIDKVDVVIGPSWAATFKGALSFAKERDILMVTPSDSITAMKSDIEYENVFSLWFSAEAETKVIAEYFKERGYTKVVFLMGIDPFWQDIRKQVINHGKKLGIEFSVIEYKPGKTDFRTTLSKIKTEGPDVVFFGITGENELVGLLKQRLGIYPESKFFTTELIDEFVPKYGELLEGVIFIRPESSKGKFADTYKERFNQDPIFSASNAYDAMMVLAKTIEEVGLDASEMESYMYQNSFDTVTFGQMRFDELGGPSGGKFEIKTIIGGELK